MLGGGAEPLSRRAVEGPPMLRQSRWEERILKEFCSGEVILKELEAPALPAWNTGTCLGLCDHLGLWGGPQREDNRE